MTETQLPNPGEPLTLADGTRIAPDTGEVVIDSPTVEVPSGSQAQAQIAAIKHKLADLPAPPKQMNTVSVVLFYNIMGVDDYEIAYATGLTEQQIGQIRMSDIYEEFRQKLLDQIHNNDSGDIRNLFNFHARRAAEKVGTLVDSSNSAIALAASKDVLDRAGHRPTDVVEHKHSMENALRIEIVTKKDEIVPELPESNMENS